MPTLSPSVYLLWLWAIFWFIVSVFSRFCILYILNIIYFCPRISRYTCSNITFSTQGRSIYDGPCSMDRPWLFFSSELPCGSKKFRAEIFFFHYFEFFPL